MQFKRMRTYPRTLISLMLIGIGLPILLAMAGTANNASQSDRNVYIAFGFHVNLYHSFRNDTNDENGFGKDIRIIRHIIDTLDRYNTQGVPVKAVWDFDNLFSLQEILPQYAPDIITNIRRRVRSNGDEVILMSYNNGLVSAMTEQELSDAMRWAVSNPWQSGVKDLFGTYTPIVRPQEMMTTPGNFSLYQKQGIRAVALYYSATPFDTFRVFSRQLTRTEAHNPIRYRHPETKEEMVIIPTYHFGDLVEHVSLKNWVGELSELQSNGELDRDALIFINYDADSDLWSGIDMPWLLKWLPNTRGLSGLIEEVADLSRVQFTTLGNYLDHHPPAGTFYFSQDTADGSYNGYNSWAEKAEATQYWTAIERNRRLRTTALKTMPLLSHPEAREEIEHLVAFADMKRLRALSTTNFGMATPFLSRQRQQAMAGLTADLDQSSDQIEQRITTYLGWMLKQQSPPRLKDNRMVWRDTLMVLQPNTDGALTGNRFLSLTPPPGIGNSTAIVVVRPNGERLSTIDLGSTVDDNSRHRRVLYISGDTGITDGVYFLFSCESTGRPNNKPLVDIRVAKSGLSNANMDIRFTPSGLVEGIYLNGVRQADGGSLIPYLKYDQQVLHAESAIQQGQISMDGLSASISLAGKFSGPPSHAYRAGRMDYRLTLMANLPYLLVQGRITYPSTKLIDLFKAQTPDLMLRADMRWQEVAPAEIRFTPRATMHDPVRILKRNYLNIETEYRLDYFRHDKRNLKLDNVNNHITASYVGLVSGNHGMAVAKDNSIQSNFAFAPLKVRYHVETDDFSINVNPFGTYCGRQYQPQTWGNRQGYEVTLLTGEQFSSSGPTYNGRSQNFALLYTFFEGPQIPERIKLDLIGFSHPPIVISCHGGAFHQQPPEPLHVRQALVADSKEEWIQFNAELNEKRYRCTSPLSLEIKILWANIKAYLSNTAM